MKTDSLLLPPPEPAATVALDPTPSSSFSRGSVKPWKRRARRSLRLATLEGVTSKAASTIADNATVPLAVALQATPIQISMLGALPKVLSVVAQLMAPAAMRHTQGARRLLYLTTVLATVVSSGIVGVPLLPEGWRVWALVALAVSGTALLDMQAPAWASWFTAQVRANRRGQFQATRTSIASAVSIGVLMAIGTFLDSMSDRILLAFGVLFVAVALLRLSSAAAFYHVHERPAAATIVRPSLVRFINALEQRNLRRILLYSFGLSFGSNLAGAFFTPYQLEVLGFSYSGVLMPAVVSALSSIAGMYFWGRIGDRAGNLRAIRWSAMAIGVMPILWLWVRSPVHVALINVMGGFVWAGYGLCSLHYICELSTAEDRASYVAYLAAANGIAAFLGAMSGAGLLGVLPPVAGSAYCTLFVISGLTRMAAGALFLPGMTSDRRPRVAAKQ